MKLFLILAFLFQAGCSETPTINKVNKVLPVNKDSIISCNCLSNTPVEIDSNGDTIFTKTDTDAGFPYGFDSLKHFLERNIDSGIPAKNGAPDGSYTVIIKFVVDKYGKSSGFKALTKNGYGMEEEVLSVYKKIKKFKPGTINEKNISSYRKAPYTFKIP